jgi:hypothetical protein
MADNKQIQDYSSELYKTVTKFNPTATQNAELNAWAGIQNVNQSLYNINDPLEASKEFKKLDKNVQDIIAQQNPNAPFLQEGPKRSVGAQILDGLRSYANAITGVYRGAKYAQQEKISFSKAWDMTRDNGEAFFDRDRVQKVDAFYAPAVVKVAKMASIGKSAGEILANINMADAAEVQAYQDYLDVENNKTMQQALGDYNLAKISLGRDLAYDVLGLRVKPGEYGTARRKVFGIVSATGDLATNILFDPLTYVPYVGAAAKIGTLGVARAARSAAAIGGVGTDASKIALGAKISDAFGHWYYGKAVTRLFDNVGAQVERLAKGTEEEASQAYSIISREFGKDVKPEVVQAMVKAQVFNADAAKKFFQDAQNFDLLLNGKMVYGKPVLPTYSIVRGYKDQIKNALLKTTGISTTKAGTAAAGITAETLLKTIAKPDFIQDEAARALLLQGIKDSANKASKFARFWEIAPKAGTIKIGKYFDEASGREVDKGLESLKDVISLGRIAGMSRPDADELGRVWSTASVAQRKNIHKGLVFAMSDELGLFQGLDSASMMRKLDEIAGTQEYALDQVVTPALYKSLPKETQKFLDNAYKSSGGILKTIKDTGQSISFNPGRLGSDKAAAAMEHQLTFELRTPDLRAIRAEVYSARGAKIRSFGQVFNSKYSEALVSTWAFLTLVPRLGIRSAIEEIGVFGLVATPKMLVNLVRYGFSSSRAIRRVNNRDAAFFDSKGLGAVSRIYYGMFQKHIDKDILDSINKDASVENVAKQINIAIQRGRGILSRTDSKQFYKDLEDFALYGIDTTPYNEAVMAATAGTNINSVASKGYGSGIKVSQEYGPVQRFSLNRNKFEKSFVSEGPAVKIELQSQPDAYYMALGIEFFKRAGAGGNTSKLAIKYINDPKKAIAEIRKELDSNPTLAQAFTNNINGNVSNSELASSIYFANRQTFVNKAGDVNPELVKLVYTRVKDKKGKIVDNWTPDIDMDKLRLMREEDLPTTVLSQKWVPIAENMGGLIYQINQKGYKWMDRQISTFTREPIFHANLHYYRKEYRVFENTRRAQLIKDGLSPETADKLARRYATDLATEAASKRTLDFVDNPLIRTNLAFGLRNFARFYRATEDFWRRAYRISTKQTDAIVRLRLATQGLEHSGFVYEDDQGELYFVFPGDDVIYNAVSIAHRFIDGKSNLKLPQSLQFTGKVKFLSPSLDPQSSIPTFSGPLAGISMVVLQQHAPNFWGIRDRILGVTLGEMSKNATYKDVILPPAAKRLLSFMSPNDVNGEMASAQRQAYAYLVANGQGLDVDATPEEKLKFQQNLEALASNLLTTRFFLGFVSPVALSAAAGKDVNGTLKDLGNVTFKSEFYKTVEELTAQGSTDPWGEANMKWAEVKPGVLAYTIAQTERNTIVGLRQTTDAIAWLRKNETLVNKYPEGSAFFVPNTGTFAIDESRFFQREGFIDKIPVEDFMTKVTAQEQLNEYYTKRDEWDSKIENAPESIRAVIRQQKTLNMQEFTKGKYYLQKALENYGSAADTTAAWEELVRMIDNGDVPKTEDAQKIVDIVNLVQEANDVTAMMFDGTVDASQRRTMIRNNAMQQALDIANNNAGLTRIINTVVKKQLGV